jgi:hypothetical protein
MALANVEKAIVPEPEWLMHLEVEYDICHGA